MSGDTLALDQGAAPCVRPGVHSVRQGANAAERSATASAHGRGGEGKALVTSAAPAGIARSHVFPAAPYLLAPRLPGAGRAAAPWVPLDPVLAAVALGGRARLGGPFDGVEHAAILDRVVAPTVGEPVWLGPDRDFDRTDAVVDGIAGWHDGSPTALGARVG